MRYQSRFVLWLLVCITGGIYGLVWYYQVNRDLMARLNMQPDAASQWWSQLIPIFNLVSIHITAERINKLAGIQTVSPVLTWLFWSWFIQGSVVHMQRGVNIIAQQDATRANTAASQPA